MSKRKNITILVGKKRSPKNRYHFTSGAKWTGGLDFGNADAYM